MTIIYFIFIVCELLDKIVALRKLEKVIERERWEGSELVRERGKERESESTRNLKRKKNLKKMYRK